MQPTIVSTILTLDNRQRGHWTCCFTNIYDTAKFLLSIHSCQCPLVQILLHLLQQVFRLLEVLLFQEVFLLHTVSLITPLVPLHWSSSKEGPFTDRCRMYEHEHWTVCFEVETLYRIKYKTQYELQNWKLAMIVLWRCINRKVISPPSDTTSLWPVANSGRKYHTRLVKKLHSEDGSNPIWQRRSRAWWPSISFAKLDSRHLPHAIF